MIDLDKNPEEIANAIISAAKNHRKKWMDETTKNLRRIAGYTESDVPTETTDPAMPSSVNEDESYSARYVTSFNVTRNFFYRLLGRIMPVLMRFQVLAASRDRSDRDAAQIAGRYLQSRSSPDSGQDFEPIVRAFSYLFAGGPAWLRVEPVYTDGEYGDVDVSAVLGAMVYYYPGIMEINESPAIVLDEHLTKLVIERRYPELAGKIKWEAAPGAKWPDDCDLSSISPKLSEGCYTLRRVLIRPTPKWKEGREHVMVVGVNGIVETRETLDTADKMYPLVALCDIPMGPFFEDRGRMTISAKMQEVIDICVSKGLDIILGGPQVIVGLPAAGSLTEDDFTNKAWMFYDKIPGQELAINNMPGTGNLLELINLAMNFIGEVHAQNEASRGQSAGDRTSGRALEQMTAMDSAVDEPFLAMSRRSLGRYGKRAVMEAKRVLAPDAPFVSMSKNQRHQMESFRAADLKDGFDVRVSAGSGLPDNKSARLQLVIKGLGDVSIFADDPIAVRARSLLGMRVDDEDEFEFDDEEEQIIRDEDDLITKGTIPEVSYSDSHQLHRRRHRQANNRRRSEKKNTPAAEKAGFEHDKMHVEAMKGEVAALMPPAPPQPMQSGPQTQ